MSPAYISAAFFVGYLLGSVPFAVLVARRHGVDILKAGSGNPGATNVKRTVGRGAGNLVFTLDFLKGFFAAHWPMAAVNFDFIPATAPELWMGIAGLAGAVAGHSFSLFLRFRGGKGVATTIGGLLALMPFVTLGGLVVWVAVFYGFGYVSVASIAFGFSLLPLALLLRQPRAHLGLCLVLSLLIFVRHLPNLRRLASGTEQRYGRKKDAEAAKEPDDKSKG